MDFDLQVKRVLPLDFEFYLTVLTFPVVFSLSVVAA